MARSYDGIQIRRLKKGDIHKFWKAELRGATLTITSGDLGTPGETEVKSYPSPYDAASFVQDQLIDMANRGYVSLTPKELGEEQAKAKAKGKVTAETATKPKKPPAKAGSLKKKAR